MISNVFGLNGKIKIDTYTRDDKLKNTTDWIDNFITPTGLSYLFYLSPADCFRYVSLGSGTTANTINGKGTTGLAIPIHISGIEYVGGAADVTACNGHDNAFNRYVANGCGYQVDNSGVVLHRAWRIPDAPTIFFTSDYTFQEYMLSPGQALRTGLGKADLSDPLIQTGFCACGHPPYTYSGDGVTKIYGRENWELYQFYKNRTPSFDLCANGQYAFARIIKQVPVTIDEYLIVNYALTINYNTGIQTFSLPVTVPNTTDNQDLNNWKNAQNISGIYALVHPGIKLVNGSNPTLPTYYVTDLRTQYQPEIGESFVPPLGNTFEAACDVSLVKCYISSDALQFLVNEVSGGGMDTGLYFPYSSTGKRFPSGVLTFHKNWISETSTSALGDKIASHSYFPHFITPRHSWTSTILDAYPDDTDFKGPAIKIEDVLDGSFIPTTLDENQGSDAVQTYSASDRFRSIIRSFEFQKFDLEENFPVRSAVIAYDGGLFNTSVPRYYPFIDLCFSPTSGSGARMPAVQTGHFTYKAPLEQISSTTHQSGYSFMTDENKLSLQFKVTWSSPCSPEVVGC